MFGRLIDSGGNECALILLSYSPCAMEMDGEEPDAAVCSLAVGAERIHALVEAARGVCHAH